MGGRQGRLLGVLPSRGRQGDGHARWVPPEGEAAPRPRRAGRGLEPAAPARAAISARDSPAWCRRRRPARPLASWIGAAAEASNPGQRWAEPLHNSPRPAWDRWGAALGGGACGKFRQSQGGALELATPLRSQPRPYSDSCGLTAEATPHCVSHAHIEPATPHGGSSILRVSQAPAEPATPT